MASAPSQFSRRSLLGIGAAAVLGLATGSAAPQASTEDAAHTGRPSGPGYVRYEDLYEVGDTVSEAMARLSSPAIITFPEGQFECSGFTAGWNTGISVPKIAKGIWGSGAGTLGGDIGTVFTMKPHSSKKGSIIPSQSSGGTTPTTLMMQSNSLAGGSFRLFQIAGTEQGHIFHGFSVFNPGGPVSVTDVLVTGWAGDSGAPPGETFGLTIHGGHESVLTRVEADGRRSVGGESYGPVGLTFQDMVGGSMVDCAAHHCLGYPVALFQSFNIETHNLKVGRADDKFPGVTAGGGINHERTSGCAHHDPIILTRDSHRGVHVTHSNDTYTITRDAQTHSTVNGSLEITNPTYNDIWGNNEFYVETWVPYGTGNTMTADNPPRVTNQDGAMLPYTWAFAGKHYKIS